MKECSEPYFGIKTIEHGTFMSEETMELMKSMMRIYPTLTAGKEKCRD
jgi:imidazolonepropionase-like amidohydrolase